MKLATVRIRNFKLLRHIDLQFSTEPDKPLTVIRAENGSGKTSTLQALRWALYGQEVMEDPLIRLSPADWPDQEKCKISVEIDFIHTAVSQVNGRLIANETGFILKREVEERPVGDIPNRGPEDLMLFEKTDQGAEKIEVPDIEVRSMLPRDMIDIFFTDGDAAMTFISPQLPDRTKQDKVMRAIRLLLGLRMMEGITKRIKTERSKVNKQIRNSTGSQELATVIEALEQTNEERERLRGSLSELNEKIESVNHKLGNVSRDLLRALEAGNHEQLAHQRKKYRDELEAARREDGECKIKHQALFQSEALGWGLVGVSLRKGFEVLQDLHARGVIPGTAIPVLRERLEIAECICGADLSQGTRAYTQVMELIKQQLENDQRVENLSALYYHAKGDMSKWDVQESQRWQTEATELRRRRFSVQDRIDGANQELKSIDNKLEQIDEQQIEQLREQEKMWQASLQKQQQDLYQTQASLQQTEERLQELQQEQKRLRRLDQRMHKLNAQLTALDDLSLIVGDTLHEMQNEYLGKVSQRMNQLFLHMAGADPDQGATFQGTEITPSYNIVVHTKDDRTLNPDHEVNGASQRALTFAFIWALTEVSGVVAPRVIDTPLGMMSGSVKRRVLEMVSRPAGEEVDRQVILFLTQSEIAQTEDILDERVGAAMTLTKTDDYPIDLVNDPEAGQSEIRICGCSHRQYCEQCQRINVTEYNLQYRNRHGVK